MTNASSRREATILLIRGKQISRPLLVEGMLYTSLMFSKLSGGNRHHNRSTNDSSSNDTSPYNRELCFGVLAM
jgi:hypothetical protein